MGHDIGLIDPESGKFVARTSISFNHGRMRKYFHIRDIHGHCGNRGVLEKLTCTMSKLQEDGYDPRQLKKVDPWGVPKECMSDNELSLQRGHMFASIINHFVELAEEFPNAYWFSDQVFESSTLYGVDGVEEDDIKHVVWA